MAPRKRAWSTSVLFALEISKRTGVLPEVRRWRDEERERLGRHAGGAPTRFPPEALWVAMILAALHDRPMHATTFSNIMFTRISPAMRERLGVPDPPASTARRAWLALDRCVRTRFHALLEAIDPSPLPKNYRLGPAAFDAAVSQYRTEHQLTDDVLASRLKRLAWVANTIIEASWSLVPRHVRRHWRGSVGLDATPIPAFARPEQRARGKGPRAKRAIVVHSADPDAGLYVRTDYGNDTTLGARPGKKLREAVCAYEATLVVAGNDEPKAAQPFPALVVGMALHRPGTAISRNAVEVLTSVVQRGHPMGWLAADRAYTNAIADDFQLPARALGYRLVLDYRVDQLGVQDSYAGALLVEGWWYSAATPTCGCNVQRRAMHPLGVATSSRAPSIARLPLGPESRSPRNSALTRRGSANRK